MDPVGIGIIGTGVGRRHAQGIADDPRVGKLVLCGTDQDKLERIAAEVGVLKTSTDRRSLVERDDLQVVTVATPDHLHPEMSIAAVRAGKHVLCEKPMAPTLAEARHMVRAVQDTGKKLMVNNVLRIYPRFRHVKSLVDTGSLGRIYAAEADYLHDTARMLREGWRGTHRNSVTTGSGVHMIDLLLWILGDVDEAFCYSTNGVLGPDEAMSPDCMLSVLRFKSRSIAKSMINMVVQHPPLHYLILYGTEGTFVNGEPDAFVYRSPAGEREHLPEEPQTTGGTGLRKAAGLSHLLDCIERDEEPLVNASEGARAIAVCDAINRSASTGRSEQVEAP